MKFKKALVFLITAVTSVFIVSCGFEKSNEVLKENNNVVIRFSWWGNDARNKYTLEGLKLFEQQNKGVTVNGEYREWTGFGMKMDVEVYSDTEADVMQLNYDWLYRYVKQGKKFYNLNNLTKIIRLGNFNSTELQYGCFDGQLLGIPVSFNAETFYYNKTLYDHYGLEVPKTWKDIFDSAKVMKKDEVYPLALTEKTFWLCCNAMNEQAFGHTLFDEDGKYIGTKEDIATMISFYQNLINQRVSKRPSEFNRKDLENGKVAGIVVWISDADNYCDSAEQTGFEMVVGDYPIVDGYKAFGWYMKPTSLYVIKETTEHPEESAKLVDFLLNDEDMAVLQGTEKGIPISNSAVETLEGRNMLNGLGYKGEKKRQRTKELNVINPCLENEDAISIFIDACESVLYQKSDLFDASRKASEKLKELFNK